MTADDRRDVIRSIGARWEFWIAAAVVFLANAVLSSLRDQWLLAAFQIVTGAMAVLAALGAVLARGHHDDRAEPGDSAT